MESLAAPRTLVQQAYEVILNAIGDGTLKPGERLTQESVARRLNVSRQPIHNALLVLRAQGFVRETGRRGLVVAPLEPQLFEAIYQFRSAIEPLAVRLAMPRLDEAARERGRDIVVRGSRLVREANAVALVQADAEFHSFIYALSGNSLIVETMRVNWLHLRRAMGEVLRLPPLPGRVWREHSDILDAMIAGKADEAARLMHDHMVNAYHDVQRNFARARDPNT
jgi:DNA-binding GntR family transcriptional regulator